MYQIKPTITFKAFKKLNDELYKHDTGPTPINGDKILWQLLRDGQINIFVDTEDTEDPIKIIRK